jgi:hypothetical protein
MTASFQVEDSGKCAARVCPLKLGRRNSSTESPAIGLLRRTARGVHEPVKSKTGKAVMALPRFCGKRLRLAGRS